MRVLIIEDDVQLSIAISSFFEIKKFHVTNVRDGLDAIDQIANGHFDLYIIDINIPRISGLDLLKHIRNTDLSTPVIIITASLEIENFSAAFNNGCSEYIKKPFHLKELEIRLNNLLSLDQPNIMTLNHELEYDLDREEFLYQDKPIVLRYKEKRFCTLLIKHINTIVSNERIYDYVWEGEVKDAYPLRQLLVELRKKLPFSLIQTKIRQGYMIESQG